jgi:transcriptional regulator
MVLYIPQSFKQENVEETIALIKSNPLGLLISSESSLLSRESQIELSHLPFTVRSVSENGSEITLITHMAKGNDQIAQLESAGKCIVVFNGKHDSYVSASWYEQKKINHKIVSTWDYSTVHAHGEVKIVRDDKEWMLQLLNDVVDDHEGNRPKDTLVEDIWKVDDSPKPFIEAMMNGIVGVEIKVHKIEHKVKMNQNRPANDVKKIIESYKAEIGGEKGEDMAEATASHYASEL